jgi:hypothetical protein
VVVVCRVMGSGARRVRARVGACRQASTNGVYWTRSPLMRPACAGRDGRSTSAEYIGGLLARRWLKTHVPSRAAPECWRSVGAGRTRHSGDGPDEPKTVLLYRRRSSACMRAGVILSASSW